jgi:hypothetical protein
MQPVNRTLWSSFPRRLSTPAAVTSVARSSGWAARHCDTLSSTTAGSTTRAVRYVCRARDRGGVACSLSATIPRSTSSTSLPCVAASACSPTGPCPRRLTVARGCSALIRHCWCLPLRRATWAAPRKSPSVPTSPSFSRVCGARQRTAPRTDRLTAWSRRARQRLLQRRRTAAPHQGPGGPRCHSDSLQQHVQLCAVHHRCAGPCEAKPRRLPWPRPTQTAAPCTAGRTRARARRLTVWVWSWTKTSRCPACASARLSSARAMPA